MIKVSMANSNSHDHFKRLYIVPLQLAQRNAIYFLLECEMVPDLGIVRCELTPVVL